MPFSILVVDAYYAPLLRDFRAAHPGVYAEGYQESRRALLAECFCGTADFYSKNLGVLGHAATEVVVNDEVIQAQWARENGVRIWQPPVLDAAISHSRYLRRLLRSKDWLQGILAKQVRSLRPDVLFFTQMAWCEPEFMREMRPYVRLVVGQVASPMPAERYLRQCDLMLSSFPHYVERFRAMGIASEHLRWGFETTILDRLDGSRDDYGAVFVGGFSRAHEAGTAALERLASEVGLDVWGYGVETLPLASPLRRRFHGTAWGLQMYRIFRNARIVINRHIEVAEDCANNIRLYEATGVGALLVTDHKSNLGELFDVGREIVSYNDPADLVEKVRYYLAHDDQREAIARAGQARTLQDHTFLGRMREFEQIVESYL